MKKVFLLVVFIATIAWIGYYRWGLFTDVNYFTAMSDIKQGKVQFLGYGLLSDDYEIANEVALDYGFQFTTVAECMVSQHFINQVESYNYAVERYLEGKHGKGWWDRFDREIELKKALPE